MKTVLISLPPQPNKDHSLLSNYHRISLINVDMKIISKPLSHRLEKSHILHNSPRSDFIKGRQASNHPPYPCRLFNLIQDPSLQQKDTITSNLDAEKAVDRVNWTFLFTLQRICFRESFINWIRILYTSPSATITNNGLNIKKIHTAQGDQEGCLHSLSLFTIFFKPLAIAICHNSHITGIQTPQTQHKISLYVDNVLLFLQNP